MRMTLVYASSKTAIISPGVTAIMARRSVWLIHSISKHSTSWKNAYLPFNRNGVMFPRKINGNFAMLNRPE